jgi:hypothetical protein
MSFRAAGNSVKNALKSGKGLLKYFKRSHKRATGAFTCTVAFAAEATRRCFVAGTLVLTGQGLMPIEQVQAGDQVWSYNHVAEKWELAVVKEQLTTEQDTTTVLLEVTSESGQVEAIHSTTGHPYFVEAGDGLAGRPLADHEAGSDARFTDRDGGRYINAGDLKLGDQLKLRDGSSAKVTNILLRQERLKTYNLHVLRLHNYAVGANGVLVHNASSPANSKCDEIGGAARTGVLDWVKNSWGKNRFIREMHERGFVLVGKSKRGGGLIYRNADTGEQIRIMPNPNRAPYRNESPAKFENDWYYRYQPNSNTPEGPHMTLPN